MSNTATIGIEQQLEPYRRELTAYCYRMLGSSFEAEDAVQETMVRAWKAYDRFEGRSALRSWLYRIATNVCLDMLKGSQRRARPMDLSAGWTAESPLPAMSPETPWIGPVPDDRVLPERSDPADLAAQRDSVRLAFVAALQKLAPRQRAVLILREVLAWSAAEVAELLGSTVASVNSALQRARATLAATDAAAPAEPLNSEHQELLARYLKAFESYDLKALTSLLHEDATLQMPPFPLWLRGADQICAWMVGTGSGCRGSRLIPVRANGLGAFGQYRPSGPGGRHQAWSLKVMEIGGGRITGMHDFLDTKSLFPLFGLPLELDD